MHKIFLYITLATLAFVAGYSIIIDFQFPGYLLNYFFSLFYLVLSLNFIGDMSDSSDTKEILKWLFINTQNIIIYCILSACFAVIFIHSGTPIVKTALIILSSFVAYFASMFIFGRKISQFLFWINFYLFAGIIILSQFPNIRLDVISRFNPFGGLFVTLFG